jgi:hypothetical protein
MHTNEWVGLLCTIRWDEVSGHYSSLSTNTKGPVLFMLAWVSMNVIVIVGDAHAHSFVSLVLCSLTGMLFSLFKMQLVGKRRKQQGAQGR